MSHTTTDGVAVHSAIYPQSHTEVRAHRFADAIADRSIPGRKVDWSSLMPELIQAIADCHLTTNDIDCYVEMRAVCSAWRSAIAKPPPLDADDPRFRPTQWVILDAKPRSDDGTHLFLNISTSRFLRRRLPWPRYHHGDFSVASGGLLMVDKSPQGDSNYGAVLLINPFTGSLLHFVAPIPSDGHEMSAAVNCCSGPPLVFLDDNYFPGDPFMCAGLTSESFEEHSLGLELTSMIAFQGNIFMADKDGRVLKIYGTAEDCGGELVAATSSEMDHVSVQQGDDEWRPYSYLVESAGELLLVRHLLLKTFKVFRVDVERKLLQPLKSIGRNRALFLGVKRCISVDADKLPSIDGDSIYVFNPWAHDRLHVNCRHDLRDGTTEIHTHDLLTRFEGAQGPLSLIEVFHDYCWYRP